MKKLLSLMAMTLCIALLASCGDDDPTPITKENITGNWEITKLNTEYSSETGFISITDQTIFFILYNDGPQEAPLIYVYDYTLNNDKLIVTLEGEEIITVDFATLNKDNFSAQMLNTQIPSASGELSCARIAPTPTDVVKSDIVGTWTAPQIGSMASNVELTFIDNNYFMLTTEGYKNSGGRYAACGQTIHLNGFAYKMVVKSKQEGVMNLKVYVEDGYEYDVVATKK